MNMNTTPGPWIVTTSNYAMLKLVSIVVRSSTTNEIIAVTGDMGSHGTDTHIANAALISIAPDMLEALIAIQEAAQLDILDPELINHLISNVLGKLANEAGVQ